MDHQEMSVNKFEKFTWKIENFSHLKNVKNIYSEPFVAGGYPWRIVLYPRGNESVSDHSLSIYLEAMQTANMTKGWSRDVKFKLFVFNQVDTNMTTTKECNHEFNVNEYEWGFTSFMTLTQLRDPQKGFIVKDACIVGAEVFVYKSTHEKPVNQAASLTVSQTSGSQIGNTEVKASKPNLETNSPVCTLGCTEPTKHTDAVLFSPSIGELMDFSSVGQIEEVCSDNPSLVEGPSKRRSLKFIDLAFAALGRVLYFVKTRKVRDMNDQACKGLQVLWDELKKFNFDLSWLEPHVQSALGIKSYVEKAVEVENLKDSIAALELESGRLQAKLVAAEANLDIERDLWKAKGFEERDLDSELGCGSWRP